MDFGAYQRGVVLDFLRPGKPTENSCILRRRIDPLDQFLTLLTFNRHFRAECINQHWFLTLADAAEKSEAWRRYYNEEQPHGAIGTKVPILPRKSGGVTSPSPSARPENSAFGQSNVGDRIT
jgi:putative transposase